jgi:PAS domain S-box-containing protein
VIVDQKVPIHTVNNPAFLNVVEGINSHAIFMLDTKGYITSWNEGAEALSGWKAKAAIGKSLDVLYTEDHRNSGAAEKHLYYAEHEGNFQAENILVKSSGDDFLADFSISAVREGGEVKGFVVVAKDTTQRKKDEVEQLDANALLRLEIDRRKAIEKALKESNEELDAFASAAGHDLQEPLRMVVSYLQLIQKRYAATFDQDGLDFLDFAIDGATRMKTLINDLVEYSRIEKLGKPFKKTDANLVLQRVLTSMEVSIEETNAQITHDKLPVVWSDEVQLNELFQNLIANAIKFGVRGKKQPLTIHISATENGKEHIFGVTDNGPGIAKKDHKTIFMIFKQLGNKLQTEGSGVGLAICKKIIKRHKGRIWVESEVGKGSTFYFSIPFVKEKYEQI